jgi:hypothetical protein
VYLRNIFVENTEFGSIETVYRATPALNSYYCFEHSNNEVKFKVGDKLVSVNPTLIAPTLLWNFFIYKLSNFSKNEFKRIKVNSIILLA